MSERVDDLQYNGLRIIQDTDGFRFGCDSVELANFVRVRRAARVIDLGAGSGIISLLIAAKQHAVVTAVEIDSAAVDRCRRSVTLNGLDNSIRTLELRAQDAPAILGREFDCVVSNPPYFRSGSGLVKRNPTIAAARFELELTLDELTQAASRLMNEGGTFYTVYPAERLSEVMRSAAQMRLEPKQLQLLRPREGAPPHLFLLKCVYGGSPGLEVLPEREIRSYGV